MRILPAILLVGCTGTLEVGGLDDTATADTVPQEPGTGWVGEPWEVTDPADPSNGTDLPWDQATFRIVSPKSATILPLGETHLFEAELTGPGGPLPLEQAEVRWTSAQDTSWLGTGERFEDDALDVGIHSLTAQASLPDGTVLAHTVGAVLVQSPFSGTYAGLYQVDVNVAGITVACTGATTILVDPYGEDGFGEGQCLVSIPFLGGDIPLTWVFEPTIDVDGVVDGTIGVSGFGLFTYDFDAEGVVDPLAGGFDVTFAGDIPFIGTIDGYLDAPRVSIQSF